MSEKIESIRERQADFAISIGWEASKINHFVKQIDMMTFYKHWTEISSNYGEMRFEEYHNFNLEKELEKWLS